MEEKNSDIEEKDEKTEMIPSEDRCLRFYMSDEYMNSVDLDAVEPLSQETFAALIKTYRTSGKNLLVAIVKNRDVDQQSHLFTFFFNAYHLNKLLFKVKPNGELVSRHDKNTPLPVCNPLTNLPIIGEVEYYLVGLRNEAKFIGTDYTYTMNESLRKTFQDNALRPEDTQYREYSSNVEDFSRFVHLDQSSLGLLERVIEVHRSNLLSQIRVPYKKAMIFGALFVLYYILLGMVLSLAGEKVKFM
jgi:hypothetical protein